ncbi:MAG: hypothetical protein PHI18_10250, partial [bacterium]|nr:hypothetical protein [bacterium]
MKVESRKVFHHGYVLTEQDLRRIADAIAGQYEKLERGLKPHVVLQVVYRNGVTAQYDDIESVLIQENSGSSQLVRLVIKFSDRAMSGDQDIYEDRRTQQPELENSVLLEFLDASYEPQHFFDPVRYRVLGESRD